MIFFAVDTYACVFIMCSFRFRFASSRLVPSRLVMLCPCCPRYVLAHACLSFVVCRLSFVVCLSPSPLLVAVAVLRSVNDFRCPVVRCLSSVAVICSLSSVLCCLLSNQSFSLSLSSLPIQPEASYVASAPCHPPPCPPRPPRTIFHQCPGAMQCKSYHAADRADCCLDPPLPPRKRFSIFDVRVQRRPRSGSGSAWRGVKNGWGADELALRFKSLLVVRHPDSTHLFTWRPWFYF